MPNCRAISDGLMPALNAARTALTCPRVNETVAASTCCLWDDFSVRENHRAVLAVARRPPLLKYFSEGREMEIANLVIEATRFEIAQPMGDSIPDPKLGPPARIA
jgi:hypothetical protein